jgi:hypothetical protein
MTITTKAVPVEAHWSVGLVERAYPILQKAYRIIAYKLRGSETTKDTVLQMAVKAVNDTAGLDGLVLTLLVFGAYLQITKLDLPAATTTQQAVAVRKAIAEVTCVRARIQVQNALNQRNGPSITAIHDLLLNSDVLV